MLQPEGKLVSFKRLNHMTTKILMVKNTAERIVDTLSVVLFIIIFILGLAQIFCRWILQNPLTWSEEAIRLIYVWICYLGWVIAERSGGHIKITVLISKAPEGFRKYMQIFNHILTIIFSVLMVIYGIKMMQISSIGSAVSFRLNYAWVYLMAPVCNAMIVFYEIAEIAYVVKNGPKEYTIEEETVA